VSGEEYSAANLSAVTDQFAELRIPEQPRLVTDLFPVALPAGGMHLIGAAPKTLRGASLGWMVRTLFPLLDGTRTLAALGEALPAVSPSSLRDVLSLLRMHGMLEEGRDAGSEHERGMLEQTHGPQMAFFSRYLWLTGRHPNRFSAQRALAAARVAVVASPELGALLGAELEPLGVGGCVDLDLEHVDERDLTGADLAIAIAPASTQTQLVARVRGLPCLFVDPEAWTVGPLTVHGHSACPTCVRLQHPPPTVNELAPAERELWRRALLGRAAQHVVAFLTGLYQSQAFEHIERWDPAAGTTSLCQSVPQLPNCPTCGEDRPPRTVDLGDGHRENFALCFHRSALLKPWHLDQPAVIQGHLSRQVSRQMRDAKLEPRRTAGVATGSASSSGSASSASTSPSAQTSRLARILGLSFGGQVRAAPEGGHRFHRNTASAGNLGSAEAYVIVAAVDGLRPGLYHYNTVEGRLDALSHPPIAPLLRDLPTPERAPIRAVIVIVSAVDRLCAKYEARGYTYSLLDAGLMAHRIQTTAAAVGMGAAFQLDFDDAAWSRRLGIDGLELSPVALAVLSDGAKLGR